MTKTHKQSGFGLVELLIGMVVGLLLLGGILEILLGNRESFQAQQRQAALQENSRLASFLLTDSLSVAGFRTNALQDETEVSGLTPVVAGSEGGDSDTPDTVRIRMQGAGNLHDCLGSPIGTAAAPAISDFQYSIDTDNNELECEVFSPVARAAAPLVSNVENMQIQYGVDTNGDGSVDRYLEADDAAFNQAQVLSLRLQLLLASPGDVLVQPTAQSYALLDTDGGNIAVTDRIQRQVLEQVIALRNRLQ